MGKRKPPRVDTRSPLEHFESSRPSGWTHKNLLKRATDLADYVRKLINIRGVELGNSRDRDYKSQKVIRGLADQLSDSADQIKRLQEVASAAAWVIADHMSGSYGAVVPPHNTPISPEQHGDGICRVLALNLAKLELPNDMEGVEDFVTDDFNRTHGLLVRSTDYLETVRR